MFKRLEFIGTGCQNCSIVGNTGFRCCFGDDSKIQVVWVGKCANSDNTAYCTSYTRTTDFLFVSKTGSSPDETVRWEFTENGQTSWITWNRSAGSSGWTFSFKAKHQPHYDVPTSSYICDTTGCSCDSVCNTYPYDDIDNASLGGDMIQYRLIDTPLPADFCDGMGDPCIDLDPFLCVECTVLNCAGDDPDPDDNHYCPGFYIQFQPCCVPM